MIYLLDENCIYDEMTKKNAGSKAREDIITIFNKSDNYALLPLNYIQKNDKTDIISRTSRYISRFTAWKQVVTSQTLSEGDVLVLQYPVINYPGGFGIFLRMLKRRGIHLVALIHDLNSIRFSVNKGFISQEVRVLNLFDYVIEHNFKMKDKMLELNINKPKLIELEIFDYILNKQVDESNTQRNEIIIAGSLSKEKSGYIYDLPGDVTFGLYGIGYEGQQSNVNYYGSFASDDVPFKIKGKFGLVWDGNSSKTCQGDYGAYLRYNNPHKTSLYLAAGIPVIVWDQSAVADFVRKNQCGITISSLQELNNILKGLSREEYENMLLNARLLSDKIRSGYFTIRAISKVQESIDRNCGI